MWDEREGESLFAQGGIYFCCANHAARKDRSGNGGVRCEDENEPSEELYECTPDKAEKEGTAHYTYLGTCVCVAYSTHHPTHDAIFCRPDTLPHNCVILPPVVFGWCCAVVVVFT